MLPDRDPNPIVRAVALAAVHFSRPDVPSAARFFEDLGLEPVQVAKDSAALRGCAESRPSVRLKRGPAAFDGITLQLATMDDIRTLANARSVPVKRDGEALIIQLVDPNGLPVRAEWSPESSPTLPTPIGRNSPVSTVRVNRQAHEAAPVKVYRIGHAQLGTGRLERTLNWYQKTFGMIVSDFQVIQGQSVPIVAFMRFDRGDTPTDHHSLAFGSALELGHGHTAFEVYDAGEVLRAHAALADRHRHAWGIGRHDQGSQIFDYWRDDEGSCFELYADGDVFDAHHRAGVSAFTGGSIYAWGPEPTAAFLGIDNPLRVARQVVSGLLKSDDLTVGRLVALLQASRITGRA